MHHIMDIESDDKYLSEQSSNIENRFLPTIGSIRYTPNVAEANKDMYFIIVALLSCTMIFLVCIRVAEKTNIVNDQTMYDLNTSISFSLLLIMEM